MNILITGVNGQLGHELYDMLDGKETVTGIDIEDVDITDAQKVHEYINDFQPDVVIHPAAYTNVDACESNVDLAYKVNSVGAQNIASACLNTGTKMVYVSTDFVFDGQKEEPYIEFDTPNPLSIYGKSKLAGEMLASHILNRLFIVRTAWLYGLNGNNFVKSILRQTKEKDTLTVVNDQWGTPTYTKDLAEVICRLIYTDGYGIYHATNNGQCTWYDFAKKILEYAGMEHVNVLPITTDELDRPAKRPKYSVLRNFMLELTIGDTMRPWEDALKEYILKLEEYKLF
jgi:dTDP-4-dehydrorhamnose reductase